MKHCTEFYTALSPYKTASSDAVTTPTNLSRIWTSRNLRSRLIFEISPFYLLANQWEEKESYIKKQGNHLKYQSLSRMLSFCKSANRIGIRITDFVTSRNDAEFLYQVSWKVQAFELYYYTKPPAFCFFNWYAHSSNAHHIILQSSDQ